MFFSSWHCQQQSISYPSHVGQLGPLFHLVTRGPRLWNFCVREETAGRPFIISYTLQLWNDPWAAHSSYWPNLAMQLWNRRGPCGLLGTEVFQMFANQGREGMQRQRRSSPGTVVWPWDRVPSRNAHRNSLSSFIEQKTQKMEDVSIRLSRGHSLLTWRSSSGDYLHTLILISNSTFESLL